MANQSSQLLSWAGDESKLVASFHGCTFVIRKKKGSFSLRGTGKLPQDGGFDVKAAGTKASMMARAESLAFAFLVAVKCHVQNRTRTKRKWLQRGSAPGGSTS